MWSCVKRIMYQRSFTCQRVCRDHTLANQGRNRRNSLRGNSSNTLCALESRVERTQNRARMLARGKEWSRRGFLREIQEDTSAAVQASGGAGRGWQWRADGAGAARVWRERGVWATQGAGSGDGLEWQARAWWRRSRAAAARGRAVAERRLVRGHRFAR